MLDRTLAPPFNKSTAFHLLSPEKQILKNGAPVYFISGGNQEVIRVELILPAGRWFEKTTGVSYFTANILSKGTSSKSSFEIAQAFDQYGAHLDISPGLDVVSISLFTLNKNLQPALALLLELLTSSTFPDSEIELMKSIYLQNLKVNNEKTSYLASKLIRKNLFGEGYPYGVELDEQGATEVSRHQLIDHFNTFFKDVTLFVSGKITSQNKEEVTQLFSTLLLTPVAEKIIATPDLKKVSERIGKDGSIQSSLRMGKRIVDRKHVDYAGILLVNHILGGYFGSRLMKNIREEKGLTYGIHSSLNLLKHDGFLAIGADVNKENLDLTFDEIRKELKRLRTEEINQEELDTARNHFIGSLQSEITTPFAHADKIKNMVMFNLPEQYYKNLIYKIDAISSDDLLRIGEIYFFEESFTEVAVG
ncbi:MAG TPA: pitrilysin family protein [Chryseolinea sp.]|nr:pitrilysin family protein [Chryseolinea sp.]HPH46683.1 pitrilysin family protein [Chryseolinea sp.]HPM30330.1 pitrilysin family protein [Chryseolinea sp.]